MHCNFSPFSRLHPPLSRLHFPLPPSSSTPLPLNHLLSFCFHIPRFCCLISLIPFPVSLPHILFDPAVSPFLPSVSLFSHNRNSYFPLHDHLTSASSSSLRFTIHRLFLFFHPSLLNPRALCVSPLSSLTLFSHTRPCFLSKKFLRSSLGKHTNSHE